MSGADNRGDIRANLHAVTGHACLSVGGLIPPPLPTNPEATMKIRMKRNHAVVEEVPGDAMPAKFGHHFIEDAFSRKGKRDGEWEVFMQSEWEHVPQLDWKDVTAECRWSENNGFVHAIPNGFGASGVLCTQANGYRVRQVNVSFTGKGAKNGCQPGYAFVIEKQS